MGSTLLNHLRYLELFISGISTYGGNVAAGSLGVYVKQYWVWRGIHTQVIFNIEINAMSILDRMWALLY